MTFHTISEIGYGYFSSVLLDLLRRVYIGSFSIPESIFCKYLMNRRSYIALHDLRLLNPAIRIEVSRRPTIGPNPCRAKSIGELASGLTTKPGLKARILLSILEQVFRVHIHCGQSFRYHPEHIKNRQPTRMALKASTGSALSPSFFPQRN